MSALATLPVTSPTAASSSARRRSTAPARSPRRWTTRRAPARRLPRHERARVLNAVADRLRPRAPSGPQLISLGVRAVPQGHPARGRPRGRRVPLRRDRGAARRRRDVRRRHLRARARPPRPHAARPRLGWSAGITPFNHPLNQVAHKVAPAIAVGAPIVVKPSEQHPADARCASARCCSDAGRPRRARRRIVCGDPAQVLDAFLAHPAVEVISFTGGVAVGKSIAERLGYRRAVLELGGNDPLIVLADADLEEAARLAVSGRLCRTPASAARAVKRIIAVRRGRRRARRARRRAAPRRCAAATRSTRTPTSAP